MLHLDHALSISFCLATVVLIYRMKVQTLLCGLWFVNIRRLYLQISQRENLIIWFSSPCKSGGHVRAKDIEIIFAVMISPQPKYTILQPYNAEILKTGLLSSECILAMTLYSHETLGLYVSDCVRYLDERDLASGIMWSLYWITLLTYTENFQQMRVSNSTFGLAMFWTSDILCGSGYPHRQS